MRTRIALSAFAALVFSACEATSPAAPEPVTPESAAVLSKSQNAPVAWVSGGGTADVASGRSKYTFHATLDGTGEARGVFDLHFTSIDANVHGKIVCMSVDENRAFLVGRVTESGGPDAASTSPFYYWSAEDNGEGADALPDRVSPFFGRLATLSPCNFTISVPTEWTNGNVQIRTAVP